MRGLLQSYVRFLFMHICMHIFIYITRHKSDVNMVKWWWWHVDTLSYTCLQVWRLLANTYMHACIPYTSCLLIHVFCSYMCFAHTWACSYMCLQVWKLLPNSAHWVILLRISQHWRLFQRHFCALWLIEQCQVHKRNSQVLQCNKTVKETVKRNGKKKRLKKRVIIASQKHVPRFLNLFCSARLI